MARHYQIDIAEFVADADRKWVDNLLSHFDVPGVDVARQGVSRRISADGIRHIVIARRLSREGGMSVEAALGFAVRLLRADSGETEIAPSVRLRLDRPRFDAEVDELIAQAVESIVPRRRGRPPIRQSSE